MWKCVQFLYSTCHYIRVQISHCCNYWNAVERVAKLDFAGLSRDNHQQPSYELIMRWKGSAAEQLEERQTECCDCDASGRKSSAIKIPFKSQPLVCERHHLITVSHMVWNTTGKVYLCIDRFAVGPLIKIRATVSPPNHPYIICYNISHTLWVTSTPWPN